MQYAFARCDHRIEAPDFDPSFHDASIVGSTMGHMTKQLTWVLPIMQTLPDWVTIKLNSDMASYVTLQRVPSSSYSGNFYINMSILGHLQTNRQYSDNNI
jgi:hypothetical protein